MGEIGKKIRIERYIEEGAHTVKKRLAVFPSPSRDVTDQTLTFFYSAGEEERKLGRQLGKKKETGKVSMNIWER